MASVHAAVLLFAYLKFSQFLSQSISTGISILYNSRKANVQHNDTTICSHKLEDVK